MFASPSKVAIAFSKTLFPLAPEPVSIRFVSKRVSGSRQYPIYSQTTGIQSSGTTSDRNFCHRGAFAFGLYSTGIRIVLRNSGVCFLNSPLNTSRSPFSRFIRPLFLLIWATWPEHCTLNHSSVSFRYRLIESTPICLG